MYVGINMNSLSFIKAISVTWFLIRVMLFMQTVSRNMLGKDWRQKEEGAAKDEMASSITDSMDMNLSKLWKIMKDREVWYAAVHGVTKSQTWLSDWTTKFLDFSWAGSYSACTFNFLRRSFPERLYHFTFQTVVCKGSGSSTFLPVFGRSISLSFGYSHKCIGTFSMVLICISLRTNNVERLFMYLTLH